MFKWLSLMLALTPASIIYAQLNPSEKIPFDEKVITGKRDMTESANFTQEYISYFLEKEPTPGIEKEYEYIKTLLPGIKLEEVNALAKIFADDKNRFVYVTGHDAKANGKSSAGKDLLTITIIETTKKQAKTSSLPSLMTERYKAGK